MTVMSNNELVVAAGNEGQLEAWDGDEGRRWAENPAFYDASIRRHHARLLQAAAIGGSDRVLDIGCGNGKTTRDAARAAAFANIGRALRPGGRLALVSRQRPDKNEWITAFGDALTLGRGLPTPPAGTPGPFRPRRRRPDHPDPAGRPFRGRRAREHRGAHVLRTGYETPEGVAYASAAWLITARRSS